MSNSTISQSKSHASAYKNTIIKHDYDRLSMLSGTVDNANNNSRSLNVMSVLAEGFKTKLSTDSKIQDNELDDWYKKIMKQEQFEREEQPTDNSNETIMDLRRQLAQVIVCVKDLERANEDLNNDINALLLQAQKKMQRDPQLADKVKKAQPEIDAALKAAKEISDRIEKKDALWNDVMNRVKTNIGDS